MTGVVRRGYGSGRDPVPTAFRHAQGCGRVVAVIGIVQALSAENERALLATRTKATSETMPPYFLLVLKCLLRPSAACAARTGGGLHGWKRWADEEVSRRGSGTALWWPMPSPARPWPRKATEQRALRPRRPCPRERASTDDSSHALPAGSWMYVRIDWVCCASLAEAAQDTEATLENAHDTQRRHTRAPREIYGAEVLASRERRGVDAADLSRRRASVRTVLPQEGSARARIRP